MQQLDLFGFPIETPAPRKKERAPKASEPSEMPVEPKTVAATAPVEVAADTKPTPAIAPPPADAIYAKQETEKQETIIPVVATQAEEPDNEPVVSSPVTQQEEVVPQPVAHVAEPVAVNPAPAEVAVAAVVAADPVVAAQPKVVKTTADKPVKQAGKRGRKSFKEMDSEADLVEVPDDETLQKKLYYSISEVASWFKVNTSLLRYWENEFDVLQPRKTRKGDRLFRVEDIKNLQLIYFLLRQRKFSIDGAKNYLKNNRQEADTQIKLVESLTRFRSFLLEMKATLQA